MDRPSVDPGRRDDAAGAPRLAVDGTLDLPAETGSVPRARRFVREVLASRHDPEVLDAAELCVSELVTNAVLHARTEVQVRVEDLGEAVHEVGLEDALEDGVAVTFQLLRRGHRLTVAPATPC